MYLHVIFLNYKKVILKWQTHIWNWQFTENRNTVNSLLRNELGGKSSFKDHVIKFCLFYFDSINMSSLDSASFYIHINVELWLIGQTSTTCDCKIFIKHLKYYINHKLITQKLFKKRFYLYSGVFYTHNFKIQSLKCHFWLITHFIPQLKLNYISLYW